MTIDEAFPWYSKGMKDDPWIMKWDEIDGIRLQAEYEGDTELADEVRRDLLAWMGEVLAGWWNLG
jgi:hypothetical protein